MPFVKLTSAIELPLENQAKEFSCDGKEICIANVNGTYSAMDNICPHRGGPLAQGMVERGKIICPWHGWKLDMETGVADENSNMKVAVYPIKMENGDLLIHV